MRFCYCNRPCPIKKIDPDAEKPVSALSRMIEESAATQEEDAAAAQESGVALTIYLPDYNSLSVNVKETSNFRDVILKILQAHEKLGLEPPLLYNDPGNYELRIHEGKPTRSPEHLKYISFVVFNKYIW